MRVLLVDDNRDLLRSAARTWHRLGLKVTACATVDEARARLLTETFDAVVSDTVRSYLTHTSALTIAEQVCPEVPRFLVSGKDEQEVARLGSELHATAWLSKPLSFEQLRALFATIQPRREPTRRFLWREDRLVFVVGPPPGGCRRALDLISESASGGDSGVVLAGDGPPESAVDLVRRLPSVVNGRLSVAYHARDRADRRTWTRGVESTAGVEPRAFDDLTRAVEWVVARLAGTLPTPDLRTATKPRVLVVDDEPPLRVLVARFLLRLGAEVLTASNVDDAIETLRQGPVDAAVIDKNMPGRSGMELLEYLRTELPGVATVMMTADPTMETRAEAERLGVLAYLEKPFNLDDLQDALSRALKGALTSTHAAGTERLSAVTEMLRAVSDGLDG